MCFFVCIEGSAVITLLDPESMISESKTHEKQFGNLLLPITKLMAVSFWGLLLAPEDNLIGSSLRAVYR